jgi:hypothetical protein
MKNIKEPTKKNIKNKRAEKKKEEEKTIKRRTKKGIEGFL